MKNRILRVIAFVTASAMIIALGLFANSVVGNPISKLVAKTSAENHLKEIYPDSDYVIEDTNYSLKDGYYHAGVVSPSSRDTKFSISVNWMGKIIYDNYENRVVTKMTTAERLDKDYRELCEGMFASSLFPYTCDIAFGALNYGDAEMIEGMENKDENFKKNYLNTKDLVLDGVYDTGELGRTYGSICLYVETEQCTAEMAQEILLKVMQLADGAGIGFYNIDLTLQHPRNEDAKREEPSYNLLSFRYSDFDTDDLIAKIQEVNEATNAYYNRMDEIKNKEIAVE